MCPTKSFLSSSKGLWAVFPLLGKLPKPKTSTRPYYCYGLKAKFNVGLLTVEITIHKEISAVPIYSGFHLDYHQADDEGLGFLGRAECPSWHRLCFQF